MFDLTGKTALVTGASGGLGGAIARAFHAQGAFVVLSGTREHALASLRLLAEGLRGDLDGVARLTAAKAERGSVEESLRAAAAGLAAVEASVAALRGEFLRLLTTDSETHDRRRREFNQAIFNAKGGWAVWSSTDLGMVMEKFDKAARAALDQR